MQLEFLERQLLLGLLESPVQQELQLLVRLALQAVAEPQLLALRHLQLPAPLEGSTGQGRFNQNLHRIPEEDFPAEEEDLSTQAHHQEQ